MCNQAAAAFRALAYFTRRSSISYPDYNTAAPPSQIEPFYGSISRINDQGPPGGEPGWKALERFTWNSARERAPVKDGYCRRFFYQGRNRGANNQ